MATRFTSLRVGSPIKGIVTTVPEWELPQGSWAVASNVRSFKGRIEMVGGVTALVQTIDGALTFIKMAPFFSDSTMMIVGTNQSLYKVKKDGESLTRLNTADFHGTRIYRWEMASLLNNAYFTNGTDPIQWIQGADGNLVPLTAVKPPGLDPSILTAGNVPVGRYITDYQNHLLVGGLGGGSDLPQSVMGSALGNTQYWNTVDLTHEARSFLVPGENSSVMALRKLGDYLIIFKQASIHAVTYVSGQLVYQRQQVSSRTGTPSGASVITVSDKQGDRLYFIGNDNIYTFDGTPHAMGDRVWNWWLQQIDQTRLSECWGFWNPNQKEIIWTGFWNLDGSPAQALVYDLDNDAFYTRDFPFTAAEMSLPPSLNKTWDSQSGTWVDGGDTPWVKPVTQLDQKSYVGDSGGFLYLYEPAGVTGTNTAVLTSGLIDFGDESVYKIMDGLRVDLLPIPNTEAPLQVYVTAFDEINDQNAVPQLVGQCYGPARIDFTVSGRWFQITFKKVGGFFSLGSYAPSFRARGQH